MQNEMNFYDHYKMFEYNHDFVILLKYKYIYIYICILKIITCICVRVYLLFGVNNFTIYEIVTIFNNTFVFN